MAGRIRTIKPEFAESESVGRLSRDARLLFLELFTLVDDDGRCRGNSKWLARALFPFDEDGPDQIDGWLSELEGEGMVRRYRVGRDSYLDIPKWRDHQRIDKPKASKLPSWDDRDQASETIPGAVQDESTTHPGHVPAVSVSGPGPVSGPGEDQDQVPPAKPAARAVYEPDFEIWWKVYPRKEGKPAAAKEFKLALKGLALLEQHGARDKALDWLMMRTRAYADSPAGKRVQYVPHAERWLKHRRFEDDEREWQRTDDRGKPERQLTAGQQFDPNASSDPHKPF